MIAKQITRVGIGAIFAKVVPALAVLMAAKWLSPSDYGVFGLSLAIISAWQVVLDLGLNATLAPAGKALSDRDEHFTVIFWLGLLGIAACVAAAVGIGTALGVPGLWRVCLVHALILPLLAFIDPAISQGLRTLDFSPIFLRQVGPSLVMALATITLAFAGYGSMALAIGMVVGALMGALLIPLSTNWRPQLRSPGTTVLRAIDFGREVLVSRICGYGVSQLDAIILGAWCGPASVGFWRLGSQVWGLPMGLVPPVLQVISGHINASKHDIQAIGRTHLRYALLAFVGMAAVSLVVIIAIPSIVTTFLGPQWTPAVPVIQAVFSTITGPMVMINNEMARILQRNKPYIWFSLVRTSVTMLALTAGAAISFKWFIVAWVVTGTMATGFNMWIFFRFCSPFPVTRLHLVLYGAGIAWSFIVLCSIGNQL